MSTNAEAWEELFAELPIVDTVDSVGFYDLSAREIKRITNREPRLMAKIDFREQLPEAMKRESLAMLAVANGIYRIGHFDPFINLNTEVPAKLENVTFQDDLLTLNLKSLGSEAAALDAALFLGILPRVFGEDVVLTVRGRSRSTPFKFTLNNIPFPVDGVQIEIDGGYEGASTINLIEAKIGARNNISLRQVLYPQLAWETGIEQQKSVRTFVCFWQEPILRFIPLIVSDGSWRANHAGEMAFALAPEARLRLNDLAPSFSEAVPCLSVPFPQADKFDTVLAMLSVVAQHESLSKDDLLRDFDIVPRQIDYYANAMAWLGLVKVDETIQLTESGRGMSRLGHAERLRRLAEIIFSEPIFNYALHHGTATVPAEMFERWRCGGSTVHRRLRTVAAWINYFRHFE